MQDTTALRAELIETARGMNLRGSNVNKAGNVSARACRADGAEGFLMDRCIDRDVFVKAEHMINGFKDYFISHNEVVYDNPSPGNKAGGITTLEEKSLGCIHKGGHSPINAVYDYAKQVESTQGLVIMDTPGNDPSSVAGMVAGGAQLVVFSTGRGTPTGNP